MISNFFRWLSVLLFGGCWHDWTVWSKPYDTYGFNHKVQHKTCAVCNKQVTRVVI